MLFNSFTFAIFFLIVYSLYCCLWRHYRKQNILLLVASYIFYGWWDVRFLFLIILSTTVDYVASNMIDRGNLEPRQRFKVSAYFLVSLFLFIVAKWDAVTVDLRNLFVSVDWNRFITLGQWDRWALVIGIGGLAVFHGLYPMLRRLKDDRRRKIFLLLSVVINLSILGFFKYFNFFSDNLTALTQSLFNYTPGFVTLKVVLPVGISFFTFQTMSHTIDVYRRRMPATKSLVELSAYVAFFPQLVAGPIERGAHLLPQFQRSRKLNKDHFREGMWLIFWGLYKKVVVADNMARLVNAAFGPCDRFSFSEASINGIYLLLAVYAFAIQIYCDFSGYSDIARGTARLMGFDIMLNFNLPYFSKNPSEFWQRWHISLSSWLRDYLYIPLGGNRDGLQKTLRNLTITMVLGGLWHGAAWTFVIWGAFHGLILVICRLFSKGSNERKSVGVSLVQVFVTFHLVCLGWLFFRAQNLATIDYYIRNILQHFTWSPEAMKSLQTIIFYSWFLILFQLIQYFSGTLDPLRRCHWFVRLNVWIFVMMSIISLSARGAHEFIYFAF